MKWDKHTKIYQIEYNCTIVSLKIYQIEYNCIIVSLKIYQARMTGQARMAGTTAARLQRRRLLDAKPDYYNLTKNKWIKI